MTGRTEGPARAEEPAWLARLRLWIARGFARAEDVLYIGLGILLALSAAALLVSAAAELWTGFTAAHFASAVVSLLDRLLLTLMIVELLYTVQISFREHALVPEPFLIVGLIAATRRVLVITAEFGTLIEKMDQTVFRNAMIELGLLTVMIVALVASLRLLRKREATAERV